MWSGQIGPLHDSALAFNVFTIGGMNGTLELQYLLHDAIGTCSIALLTRPATTEDPEPEVIGVALGRANLLEALESSMPEVWPDFTLDEENIAAELTEFRDRAIARLEDLKAEQGFVPAAMWQAYHRALFFEHLKVELEAIAAGVRTEPLWHSLWATEETESLGDVVEAGMEIKLRAVGDFLVGKTSEKYRDVELHARDFFEAGAWADLRDDRMAEIVVKTNDFASKRIAHLTTSRPLPVDREIYRRSYDNYLERLIHVFRTFTNEVHAGLLPDWWAPWFTQLEKAHGRERFGPLDGELI